MAGELTVITGSMFSGKSTRLQEIGRTLESGDFEVLFVKPLIDTRYGNNIIATHDGNKVSALPLASITSEHIDQWVGLYDAVLIDEVQFFTSDILFVIKKLLEENIDVIVAGLNMDRFGEVFLTTAKLMATAEYIEILKTECSVCGEDSWITSSEMKANEKIVLGAEGIYYPLCRSCYTVEKYERLDEHFEEENKEKAN